MLDCLPQIEPNPLLMLAAAKLLYFVDRGHLELAEDLADRAFACMAESPAALPVLGQLRQARGDFGAALAFFDRGIEMADSNPEFEMHMRVLKCIALLAADDREALEAAAAFSYESPFCPPDLSVMIAVLVTPPDRKLPQAIIDVLSAAGPDGARSAIAFTYMTSARHLVSPAGPRQHHAGDHRAFRRAARQGRGCALHPNRNGPRGELTVRSRSHAPG